MKFKKENYYTDKKNDNPNTFYIRCQKFENRRLLQSEKIKYNDKICYNDDFYKSPETIDDILDYESDSEGYWGSQNKIIFKNRKSKHHKEINNFINGLSDTSYNYDKKYIVSMFGRTISGRDICIHVKNYRPWFLIKVPEVFHKSPKLFMNIIKYNNDNGFLLDRDKKHFNIGFRYGYIWNMLVAKYNKSIVKIELVYGKPFEEFTGTDIFPYVKLSFNNSNARKFYSMRVFGSNKHGDYTKLSFVMKNGKSFMVNIKTYEDGISPNIRFFHDRKLNPVGWYNVKNVFNIPDEEKLTNCAIEFTVNYEDISTNDTIIDIPMSISNSFDIETSKRIYNGIGPEFLESDPIICIGNVFKIEDKILNVSLTLNKVTNIHPSKNTYIIEFDNETDLLLYWIELNRKMSTDIYYTYNGHSYDWEYIYFRCFDLNIVGDLFKMTKYWNVKTTIYKNDTYSSGAGANKTVMLKTSGSWNIDIYKYYNGQADKAKYPDLKLKTVSSIILEETKDDLTYDELYRYAAQCFSNPIDDKSKEKNTIINKYCLQDCALLYKLVIQSSIDLNLISKSKITSLDLSTCANSGQGQPLLSLISNFALYKMNYVYFIPRNTKDIRPVDTLWQQKLHNLDFRTEFDKKTERKQEIVKEKFYKGFNAVGGFVAPPIPGIRENIPCLDFNSMYPSATLSNNLCCTSIIKNEKYKKLYKYTTYVYSLQNGTKKSVDIAVDYTNKQKNLGILPMVCKTLLDERNKIKKKMKQYKDHSLIQYKILDGDQKAMKVLCNSVYGQTLSKSILYAAPIGGTITNECRNYIHACEDLLCGVEMTDISSISNKFKNKDLHEVKYWIGNKLSAFTDEDEFDKLELELTENNVMFYTSFCSKLIKLEKITSTNNLYVWKGFVPGSSIVYGDTDSIFPQFPQNKTLSKENEFYRIWDLSIKCEKYINNFLHNQLDLTTMTIELEKLQSWIFFYPKKKKYFGWKHERRDYNHKEKLIRGVKSVKRDATKIEKMVGNKIQRYMMDLQPNNAIRYMRNIIKKIFTGKYDYTYFLKSAKFKGFDAYKEESIENVAHIKVAKMIHDKDPSRTPLKNERIYFSYKRTKYKIGSHGGVNMPQKKDIVIPAIFITDKTEIDYKTFVEYIISNNIEILKYVMNIPDLTAKQYLLSVLDDYNIDYK
jgi:DNA polymerase elongation subunit (family B)